MKATKSIKGFWQSPKNVRDFFEQHKQALQVNGEQDWYKVSGKQVKQISRGTSVLDTFDGSLVRALEHAYPEIEWKPWEFTQVPKSFWNSIDNRKLFLNHLASKLNLQNLDDWTRVKAYQISNNGGSSLLYYYGSSLYRILQDTFPDHTWYPWMFDKLPSGFWKEESNIRSYIEWVSQQYQIKNLSEWSQVPISKLNRHLLSQYGGLVPVLQIVYPNHPWNQLNSQKPFSGKKSERFLFATLQKLFPELEILFNHTHHKIIRPITNFPMEFDAFIPTLSIAFEYQGEQHYVHSFLYGDPTQVQERDSDKRELCLKHNITLIEVPFWWDHSVSSLVATTLKVRPDLLEVLQKSTSNKIQLQNPIPTEIPTGVLTKVKRDMERKDLSEDAWNGKRYRINIGNKTGGFAKCLHCSVRLPRDELRLEIRGTFSPVHSPPYPAKFSVCVKTECVEPVLKKWTGKDQIGISIPKFDGSTFVAPRCEEAWKNAKSNPKYDISFLDKK